MPAQCLPRGRPLCGVMQPFPAQSWTGEGKGIGQGGAGGRPLCPSRRTVAVVDGGGEGRGGEGTTWGDTATSSLPFPLPWRTVAVVDAAADGRRRGAGGECQAVAADVAHFAVGQPGIK